MIRSDAIVAAVFMALGAGLAASAWRLPSGVAGLPGPGFFPGIIGIVMFLLAGGLLLKSPGTSALRIGNAKAVAATSALTLVYVALWGTGGFALRTAVYLAVLLMLLGERWWRALIGAAVLTGAVTAAFSLGLGLRLE
jgi:hypothetical protein